MTSNAIVLSIRPRYAERIIEGTKTAELRRINPKYISKGALVLIYVSSPVKSLIGAFKVEEILQKPLHDLWKIVKNRAGISQDEFYLYFEGMSNGVVIFFKELFLFNKPFELKYLKEKMNFQPPQNFRYATTIELAITQFTELVKKNTP